MTPTHWGRSIANVPRSESGHTARYCKRGKHWGPIAGGKVKGVGTAQQEFTCGTCVANQPKAVAK